MIGKLENGNGTRFSVVINSRETEFKLAILARKSWERNEELEFGFISEDGRYARNCYSGGNTGFGVSNYDLPTILPDNYRIITTNLNEMNRLADEAFQNAVKERERIDKEKTEQVDRINALPEKELILQYKGVDFYGHRSKAEYRPSHSSQVKYYTSIKFEMNGNTINFDLNNYKSKDGKYMVKSLAKDLTWKFGTKGLEFNLKEFLSELDIAYSAYKKKIKDVL